MTLLEQKIKVRLKKVKKIKIGTDDEFYSTFNYKKDVIFVREKWKVLYSLCSAFYLSLSLSAGPIPARSGFVSYWKASNGLQCHQPVVSW